jgi:hypothetical protein
VGIVVLYNITTVYSLLSIEYLHKKRRFTFSLAVITV